MQKYDVPASYLVALLVSNRKLGLTLPECALQALERCRLNQVKDIKSLNLLQAFEHITTVVDREGAELASIGKELSYHNRAHFADVVTALSIFLKYSNNLSNQDGLLALIIAVSHDLGHQGKRNTQLPQSQESVTAARVLSELRPYLSQDEVMKIEKMILGTDSSVVQDNHIRYLSAPLDTELYLQVLINEADIFASLTSELGPSLTESLLKEYGNDRPQKEEITTMLTDFKSQARITTMVAKYFLNFDESCS